MKKGKIDPDLFIIPFHYFIFSDKIREKKDEKKIKIQNLKIWINHTKIRLIDHY